ECLTCRSLQTTPPFWLEEAYADQTRVFDTGAVLRNQTLQMQVWFLVRCLFGRSSVRALDWRGGTGLMTRMLRDIGVDAYHFDLY
ncbi:MAG: methyltransferase type 11, partial [Thermoanaerobaculia bacterium]|nr:methyltransferase type 11 [Thermoanaerobaculia bacterium]